MVVVPGGICQGISGGKCRGGKCRGGNSLDTGLKVVEQERCRKYSLFASIKDLKRCSLHEQFPEVRWIASGYHYMTGDVLES